MRKFTNKVLDAMDEGTLDPTIVAQTCLGYMSEVEVQDMVETNDLLFLEDDDESV